MNKLIVSEKHNVAKRIAHILSGGKAKPDQSSKVPIYAFKSGNDEFRCLALKGHILRVDFPAKYSKWQQVDPSSLIDARIIKVPVQKGLIKAMESEAKRAREVIVATDFDREGEVIGVDAINIIKKINPGIAVKRARFSALTEAEIKKAFTDLNDVYEDLAQAGEARQDIDLIWGATLTRFLSLASSRLGKQFLSVGRVQSPTLALVAQKEHERRAFVSQKYWQIKALFDKEGEQFYAFHKTEKFWKKAEADAAFANVVGEGTVVEVKQTDQRQEPPAPFNTTAFLTAAAALKISPAQAMRIAESLYNRGFISYPRVDNTVYPKSLNLREILSTLLQSELGSLAQGLLDQKTLKPTRGKKQATDHPPIHPTGAPSKELLRPREWKVFELVSRRFMATLATEAVQKNVKISIDVNGEQFVVRGSTLVQEGWYKFYHYSRKKDEEIPLLAEGGRVELKKPILEEKETQPPPRYGQGRLIKEMEKLHLGTKSTRHLIIQNLYDRGYVHGDPLIPTETGLKVAEALQKHALRVATPEMTAELEKEMDDIASGETGREGVVDRSRGMLADVMLSLKEKKDEVAEEIREGIYGDKIMGTCPNCGKKLKIIRAKRTGKRFVGCEGYPECTVSYPLPQFGEIIPLNETCESCNAPKVKVVSKGRPPWILCLDPKCETKVKRETTSEQEKKPKRPWVRSKSQS